MSRRYTVTAALPYANGPIHIGHLAGVYLPADIYVRLLRLLGHEVLFVSGSDEGGVAITFRARQEGVSPAELVLKYHALNQAALEEFGISFDIFSRTSLPLHHAEAQAFFTRLHSQGLLESHVTLQYYDQAAATFLADRYIEGTCPFCKQPGAYGDQCEKCGSTLSPEELLEPVSRLSGEAPILKETRHWYLPLQKQEAWLRQWVLEEHPDWKSNVLGQCRSWLDQGLRARAITRDLGWGVPLPLADSEGKVLYVWFEAPVGYISATKEWAARTGNDWRPYWCDPETELVQFIGKDNIVFHCLIFPAMLQMHGGYILPAQIPANEFMNLEGQKISTSRNHAVWLHEFLAEHPDKVDVLRYVLCANMPEARDSDFTWEDFRHKNNGELVAVLGNFVHRTMVLAHKLCDGVVPAPADLRPEDEAVLAAAAEQMAATEKAILAFHFRQGLEKWMEIARLGNRYLTEMAPWHLTQPADRPRRDTILYTALQLVARVGQCGAPFLPGTALRIRSMTGLPERTPLKPYEALLLAPGQRLAAAEPLFAKI